MLRTWSERIRTASGTARAARAHHLAMLAKACRPANRESRSARQGAGSAALRQASSIIGGIVQRSVENRQIELRIGKRESIELGFNRGKGGLFKVVPRRAQSVAAVGEEIDRHRPMPAQRSGTTSSRCPRPDREYRASRPCSISRQNALVQNTDRSGRESPIGSTDVRSGPDTEARIILRIVRAAAFRAPDAQIIFDEALPLGRDTSCFHLRKALAQAAARRSGFVASIRRASLFSNWSAN